MTVLLIRDNNGQLLEPECKLMITYLEPPTPLALEINAHQFERHVIRGRIKKDSLKFAEATRYRIVVGANYSFQFSYLGVQSNECEWSYGQRSTSAKRPG